MKKTIAIAAMLASTSSFAFFGNDGDSNFNGYTDNNVHGYTNGEARGTGKFSMTINAEGSADMNGSAAGTGDNGMYGAGYRQPYYGYAPYYAPIAQ